MVKQPQGTLGYFVNGILVRKPERNESLNDSSSNEKLVYRQKCLATKPELKYRQKLLHENLMKSRRCDAATFVALKNQTKCGDLKGVFFTLSKQFNQRKWKKCARNTYSDLVELLFMPDYDERRSAIYYACLTGRVTLVRIYLSLRVAARLSENYSRYIKEEANFFKNRKLPRRTFQGWLDLLGYSAPGMLFHASDFDLCVLNSLSEEIKELMTQKKYNIIEVFEMISSAPGWSTDDNRWMNQIKEMEEKVRHDCNAMRTEATKNSTKRPMLKTKRPMLNTNDDWNDFYYDYDDGFESDTSNDEGDFEFLSHDEEYEEVKEQNHVGEDESIPTSEPDQVHQADSESLVALHTIPDDLSEFKRMSITDTITVTSWNHVDTDDSAHEECEHWSVLSDSKSESCNEWDVVSEAPSVDTFSTFSTLPSIKSGVLSYKAALMKPSDGQGKIKVESVNKSVGKKLNPINEYEAWYKNFDLDDRYDLYLDLYRVEGYRYEGDMLHDPYLDHDMKKGARGGKKRLMFKGNQRTPNSTPRCYKSYYYKK